MDGAGNHTWKTQCSPVRARVQEVQKTTNELRGKIFASFYSSPTGRAMQTAGIIGAAVNLEPMPLDELMEQTFGAIEGTVPSWTESRYRMLNQ